MNEASTEKETSSSIDRPKYLKDPSDDFWLQKPWNYDKPANADRKYPLVVSLHGAGAPADSSYAPCIVGKDAEAQDYPCFFLGPHTTAGDWGSVSTWLFGVVERLKTEYRIDTDRIYLIGFSMGGSGSYQVAKTFADRGVYFAGIVRLAGQSQTVVSDGIAERTAIWYHIGLKDTATRVTVAREAYAYLKGYAGNAGASEAMVDDKTGGYSRQTMTLVRGGREMVKKSEYAVVGHDSAVPFKNPALLHWLFSQSLGK